MSEVSHKKLAPDYIYVEGDQPGWAFRELTLTCRPASSDELWLPDWPFGK